MLLVGVSSSPLHFFQRQANSSSAIFNMHPQRPLLGITITANAETASRRCAGSFLRVRLESIPITPAHLLMTGPQSHTTPNSQGRVKHPGGHGFGEELTNCHCGLLRIFTHHVPSAWPSPGPLPLFLCSKVCVTF